VDKVVDKHPLTSRKARRNAAFNNLLNSKAIFSINKIKDLAQAVGTRRGYLIDGENIFCTGYITAPHRTTFDKASSLT